MEARAGVREETYFPIHLAVIQPGTLAPVDLFLATAGATSFVLYRGAHTPFMEETRQRLLDHGVDRLYLRQKDEKAYHEYVEQNIGAIIRDDLLPPEKASELVYESSSRVMHDVFDDPRSGRNLQRAQTMVEAMVLSIIKNPDALWHMTTIASYDYYTYTHCVNVSMFLVAGGRELLGIEDVATLQQVGLGGMLHDIGKTQLPKEILLKPGKLTEAEFDRVKEHPLLGLDMAKRHRGMRAVGANVIHWHHESSDGSGYPAGLKQGSIDRISRLAKIVDVYDALTTKRCYAAARDPFEAVRLMVDKMKSQFDEAMLRRFVKFLGPRNGFADISADSPAGAVPPSESVTETTQQKGT